MVYQALEVGGGGGGGGVAVGGRNPTRSQHIARREETISESYPVCAKVAHAFLKAFKFNFIR